MKLSIVTTLSHLTSCIAEFYCRASATARQLVGEDYEIILVNNGSLADDLHFAIQITESDSHVIVIDLSRTFGDYRAMMTGLAFANGEQLFLIDSHSGEKPEWLIDFAKQMREEHCDVVYGVQKQRRMTFLERWNNQWPYWLFEALTGLALPENTVTTRLMTRRYVDALLRHQEREVFMAGLWYITGFAQHPQFIKKHNSNEPSEPFHRKISLLINSVTSFSNAPLIGIFYIGASILLMAIGYTCYLTIQWAVLARPLSGWTSVMASIWLLGGMIISFTGVIGVYLSKIFSETKQRPYTIVRQIYGKQ